MNTSSVIITSVLSFLLLIALFMVGCPSYRVYTAEMSGKAELMRAQQNRQIIVEQAKAEKEASTLQAEAISIMGAAAQKYPEYRQQEFIGAFGQALKDGSISQIIYVPTEANIPIMEASRNISINKD